jgi:hypothetical protein
VSGFFRPQDIQDALLDDGGYCVGCGAIEENLALHTCPEGIPPPHEPYPEDIPMAPRGDGFVRKIRIPAQVFNGTQRCETCGSWDRANDTPVLHADVHGLAVVELEDGRVVLSSPSDAASMPGSRVVGMVANARACALDGSGRFPHDTCAGWKAVGT